MATSKASDLQIYLPMFYEAPEDIVLGPPKTAFASAGGPRSGKTFDSPGRGAFADDEGKADRQNYKERFRDGVRGDRDIKTRDDRPENLRNRDNDRWSGARQPRTPFGENDREVRRNGDRDQNREKDNGRDTRGGRGFESYRRNGDREGNGDERRHGQGRGKNEPSWYRDDDRPAEEEGKEAPRRDWREKVAGRGHEKDYNKGASRDTEPEWLDEANDKKQAHTQADFQRWKEKMRAGNAPAPAPAPEQPTAPESRPNHERTFSGTSKKVETPLILDSSFDGFFGKFGEQKSDGVIAGEAKKATGKSSKFTGFFTPKTEPKPQDPPTPPAPPLDPAKDNSNEDKVGFQRILKLLDQQQSSTSRNITPFREQTPRNLPQSPPPQPQVSRENKPLETLPGPRAPKESPAPNRDSEFLLNLMKHQPQIQQTRTPHSQAQEDYRVQQSSLAAFSNLMISPHDTPQQTPSSKPPPGFFDPSQLDLLPRENSSQPQLHRHQQDLAPREKAPQSLPQRQQQDLLREKLSQPQPHRQQQPKVVGTPGIYDNLSTFFPEANFSLGLPPGLNRPPGLDHPKSTQVFSSQHQQPQRQVQPPPGFQHMPNIQTSQAFPPGLVPNVASPHHYQQPIIPESRGLPQQQHFGAGQRSAGMPPPGFTNMTPNPQNGAQGFGGLPLGPYSQPDGFPPFGDFGNGGQGGYGR